jgi:hypothetical protein
MARISFDFDETTVEGAYLLACARIREVHVAVLARRIIDVAMRDQLIPAILDDSDKLVTRKRGDHKFKVR